MSKIKIGDRVRIKEQKEWPTPPGYRLANAEGTVVKWINWDERLEDIRDYIRVKLEKTDVDEYIGNEFVFKSEDLEKI